MGNGEVCCRNGLKVGLTGISAEAGCERQTRARNKRKGRDAEEEDSETEADKGSGIGSRLEKEKRCNNSVISGQPKKKVKQKDNEAQVMDSTSARWLTNGTPPPIDPLASFMFAQLSCMQTSAAMSTLTTMLAGLVDEQLSTSDLESSYQLHYSCLLKRCKELHCHRANKVFQVMLLYIRLAIHVDQ